MNHFQISIFPACRGRLYLPLLSLAMLLFLTAGANAQEPDEVVTTDTTLLQLNIGVVDRQGQPIINLGRDNFRVYEDGVPQTIQTFEPTEAPFSLVMMLDTSGSTSTFRQNLVFAASRFLDALGPDDRVAVV